MLSVRKCSFPDCLYWYSDNIPWDMHGALYNSFPIIYIPTSPTFFGVFYMVLVKYYYILCPSWHTYIGEPEENEKKALFLLTSLMSKRDNLAHTSIYEEFQVGYIISDVIKYFLIWSLTINRWPKIHRQLLSRIHHCPAQDLLLLRRSMETLSTTYSLNKRFCAVYQHPSLEALCCGFQYITYFTLIITQKFMM